MSVASQETQGKRYLIPEEKYDYDNKEVIYWTSHFSEEAKKRNVFTNIKALIKTERSLKTAECMAGIWYEFTKFVPTFICQAVCQTDDPERQHHLIQIGYDELGGQDKNIIHSKLFIETITDIGVVPNTSAAKPCIQPVLDGLLNTLVKTKSQYGIVGLLLAFEIIAEENIEMLFDCLCYEELCGREMAQTPFFKIHRADETEHIRHSIANFLRFCPMDWQREEFKASFDDGIDFWERFWDQTARLTTLEKEKAAFA